MNKLSNNELLNMLDKLKIPSTSTELKTALRELIIFKDSPENLANNFINSIGNNHSGVYFYTLAFVLDFVIFLLEHSDKKRAICILGLLNDLAYFEFSYKNEVEYEYAGKIKEKLAYFQDEYFEEKLANYL